MKYMGIILAVLFYGCSSDASNDQIEEAVYTNYSTNLIILSDLSNRILRQKSISDTQITDAVIDRLKPFFEKAVDNTKQQSAFHFYSINSQSINQVPNANDLMLNLDVSSYKKPKELSDYLFRKNGNENYSDDVEKIKGSIQTIYNYNREVKPLAADTWYFLHHDLNSTLIDTTRETIPYHGQDYIFLKKNKIILLTDGYVEAGRYDASMHSKINPNQSKYLSSRGLDKIRTAFNKSQFTDMQAFLTDGGYGLTPVNNPILSHAEFLILELDDRTLINGVTTLSPTDAEMIKWIWKDWLKASGVAEENITIYSAFKNSKEMERVIETFLNG